jgi:hypothetical protein
MGSIKSAQNNPKEAKNYWKKATKIQLQRTQKGEKAFETGAELKKIGLLGKGAFGEVWLEEEGAVKVFPRSNTLHLHHQQSSSSSSFENEILSLMYLISFQICIYNTTEIWIVRM